MKIISQIVVLGLSQALAAGTFASGPERTVQTRTFVEVAGDHEFSGRLIARPIQASDWAMRGLGENAAAAQIKRASRALEAYQIVEYVEILDHYILSVPAGSTENETSAALMATGAFEYVEPDWIVYPLVCPDDARLSDQWHHDSNIMNSCAGWEFNTGTPSVGVGICDTGIRTTHEDFQLHRLEGYNAVDRIWESRGGNISPVHPHGTMTTGCAAANGDNSVGISGVGWNLSHRMMRVSNRSSGSSSLSTLQHAALTSIQSGDRVASVSYSGVDNSSNLNTAMQIKALGGLLVWAAGNDGRNLTFGNRDADDLIVTGGTNRNDTRVGFSAYGVFVDVMAPAKDVFTADAGHNSDYVVVSGTSFACPLTAGLIALIWSEDPTLSPDDVEQILKLGCDDLGAAGVDNVYGYGRIDVGNSLEMMQNCYADFNGDGTVDTLDFLAYLNRFVDRHEEADCNQDGTIDTLDFLCFLNAFNAGC